jgi:gliding motility-associated-like protein
MQRIVITFSLLLCFAGAKAQWVTTVAGVFETPGFNDGPALSSRFFNPHGIAADSLGHVFVADQHNHTIRIFDTNTNTVSTLAGLAGQPGSTDGTGSAARFNEPWGICATPDGIVFVADTKNNKIRKITPGGQVTTLAGTGNFGTSNGPALNATFGNPTGLEVDANGNIFVADHLTHIIRKISADGMVSTLAGTPYIPGDADGVGSTAQFWRPYGLTLDHEGNVIVADEWNHKIRKVTKTGTVTTLAGNGLAELQDGQAANAGFNYPWDASVGPDGSIYVADGYNYVIRKIDTNGMVTSIAGNPQTAGFQDGLGSAAAFSGATSVAWSAKTGSLFVCDSYNHLIREITLDNTPPTNLILLNLNGTAQLCEGDELTLSAAPSNFGNYRFYMDGSMAQEGSGSSFSASQMNPGQHTFTAEITFQGQVLASNPIVITVQPMPTATISAVGPLHFYEGDSVVLIASGVGDFLWSSGETAQAITATASGDYFVEITANGCTALSNTLTVEVTPLPSSLSIMAQGSTLLCPGGTVKLASSAPTGNQWMRDGWPISGQTGQSIEVTDPGRYQVQRTDPATSITALSNEIEILAAPVANFDFTATPRVASIGEAIAFSSTGTDQPSAFAWDFGDENAGALNSSSLASPTHLYLTEGNFTVKLLAKDANGCQQTVLKPYFIQIGHANTEAGLFIPNAFTPNGDGNNDLFRVRGEVAGPFYMAVYSQWGELLFQSENPNMGWDGLRNGLPVQSGNYAYLVRIGAAGKEQIRSGTVALLR